MTRETRDWEVLSVHLSDRNTDSSKKLGCQKQWNLQVPFGAYFGLGVSQSYVVSLMMLQIFCLMFRRWKRLRSSPLFTDKKKRMYKCTTWCVPGLSESPMTDRVVVQHSLDEIPNMLQMALADFTVFDNPTFFKNWCPGSINAPKIPRNRVFSCHWLGQARLQSTTPYLK